MSPPTASTDSAMARAVRVGVPLNSRCSRKWEAPTSPARSSREPVPTQNPVVTERTSGMASVTRRSPQASWLVRINRSAPTPATPVLTAATAGPAATSTSLGPAGPAARAARALGSELAELRLELPLEGVLVEGDVPAAVLGRRQPRRRRVGGGAAVVRASAGAAPAARALVSPATPLGGIARAGPVPGVGRGARTSRTLSGAVARQRQRDLALRVDVVDPHVERLAQLDHVLDPLDPATLTELGDVHQPVAAGEDVDEGAELGDVDDLPRIDGAELGLRRLEDEPQAPTGLLDGAAVLGADGHRPHHAVVVHVDVRAGLLLDGVD